MGLGEETCGEWLPPRRWQRPMPFFEQKCVIFLAWRFFVLVFVRLNWILTQFCCNKTHVLEYSLLNIFCCIHEYWNSSNFQVFVNFIRLFFMTHDSWRIIVRTLAGGARHPERGGSWAHFLQSFLRLNIHLLGLD